MLAIWWWVGDTGGMQGNSDQNLELLDAGGLVGHLVPEGSVYSFLAEHRRCLFPDDTSRTCSRLNGAGRRWLPM